MKSMITGIKILFLSLFLITSEAQASALMSEGILEVRAEKILSEMISMFGNAHSGDAPSIYITKSFQFGARYLNNRIEIEEQMFEICRSLGADSTHALAFVIGHELTHFFQREIGADSTRDSYQAFFYGFSSGIQVEKEADIQGAFMSYLTGFSPQRVLKPFLERLYQNYRIDENKMTSYPSRNERGESFDEMLNLLERAIEIYKSAQYLTILGEHQLAAEAYSYLLTFYKGKEIYHNQGLNQLLEVLNSGKFIWDPALYPVEIDLTTRLRKPVSRAPQILDARKKRLLTEAIANFSTAVQRSPRNFSSRINRLCALILLQEYQKARDELNVIQNLNLDPDEGARLQLMEALLYIKEGRQDKEKGRDILIHLTRSPNEKISRIAKHNYNVYIRERISPINSPRQAHEPLLPFPDNPDHSKWEKTNLSQIVTFSYGKEGRDSYYFFDNGIEEKVLLVKDSPQRITPETSVSMDEMNVIFGTNGIVFYRMPESSQFYGIRNGELVLTGTLFK